MDDGAVLLVEMLGITDHAVIEARADRQQHIAMLHRHVGFVRSVNAEHAQELPVRCGVTPESHQCIRAWKTEQADELRELARGFAEDYPASAVDHRSLGPDEHL